MAITLVGTSVLNARELTGTLNGSWPSGYTPVVNDIAIVLVGGSSDGVLRTTTISGYTLIDRLNYSNTNSTEIEVFYRVLTGGDSAPTFSSTYNRAVGIAVAIYRDVNPSSPFDTTEVTDFSTASTTWAPTGLTTVSSGACVVSMVVTQDVNNLILNSGNEQGFTANMSGSAYAFDGFLSSEEFSFGSAYKIISSPGAVTNPTWEQTQDGPEEWVSLTLALKKANTAVTATGLATASGSVVRGPLLSSRTASGSASATGTASSAIRRLYQRTVTGASIASGTVVSAIRRQYKRVGVGVSNLVGAVARTSTIRQDADGSSYCVGTLNATWYPNAGITPMTIDDSVLDGILSLDSVPGLSPASIDASSPPLGPVFPQLYSGNPVPYNPGDPLPIRPAYVPFVYATFDNGVQITNAFDVSWTDPLNGTGGGQLSIPANDPQVALLVPGCRIRCWIYGVAAFTFIVENAPETVITSQSEEYGEIIRVSGRGWVAEYDAARVYPYGGMNHPLNPQQRSWTFATPNYPNLAGWGTPVSQGEQRYVLSPRNVVKERKVIVGEVKKDPLGQVILDKYGDRVPADNSSVYTETIPWPAPMDWQVPAAHWIWGQADDLIEGYNYFRAQFTLSDRTAVTVAATADNMYTVFIDGIPIMGDSENHLCWQEWKYIEVTLEPGTYTLAAVVVNVPLSSPVQSPPYPNIPGYVWIYDTVTQNWVLATIGGESLVGQPPGVFVGGPDRVVDGGGVVDGIYIPDGTFGPPFGGPMYARLVSISSAWLNPAYDGTPIGGPASSNPAGFVCAVYERDSLNRLKNIIWRTDGDLLKGFPLPPLDPQRYAWRSLAYPVLQPGWTVGQIVADMLNEAQSRGNLSGHSLGFTSGSDSDGDPWQGVQGGGSYIPGFSMAVGASLMNALDSLVDQGWIDYRMKAAVPQLQVWNQGSAGGVSGVTFTEGVNVLSLSVRQSPYFYDRLLVKWSGGFVTVGSNGREGYVTVNAQDEEEAVRRGNVILADIQNPDPAVLLEVEPVAGCQPYLDFNVGDYVTVTGLGSLRVMAITIDQDDMGNPSVSVELNKRWPATERAEYNLLQSLGEGSIGKIKSDPLVVGLPAKIVI